MDRVNDLGERLRYHYCDFRDLAARIRAREVDARLVAGQLQDMRRQQATILRSSRLTLGDLRVAVQRHTMMWGGADGGLHPRVQEEEKVLQKSLVQLGVDTWKELFEES